MGLDHLFVLKWCGLMYLSRNWMLLTHIFENVLRKDLISWIQYYMPQSKDFGYGK